MSLRGEELAMNNIAVAILSLNCHTYGASMGGGFLGEIGYIMK